MLDRLHKVTDVQVALRCRGRAEEVRLVGEAAVHRTLVRLRVDGDALYPELAAGADDAYRYLAAVCDEKTLEAHRSVLQRGSRFSTKAASPSWPSSPVRSSEITRAVRPGASIGSVVSSRRRSAFRVACATGPPCRSSPTFSSTAASNPSRETTLWIRPISRALSASNRSPVTNNDLACEAPILRTTNGAIVAGAMPSRKSYKENRVSESATATSATATRPAPPPIAAPWTLATSGFGHSSMVQNIMASRLASSRFSS